MRPDAYGQVERVTGTITTHPTLALRLLELTKASCGGSSSSGSVGWTRAWRRRRHSMNSTTPTMTPPLTTTTMRMTVMTTERDTPASGEPEKDAKSLRPGSQAYTQRSHSVHTAPVELGDLLQGPTRIGRGCSNSFKARVKSWPNLKWELRITKGNQTVHGYCRERDVVMLSLRIF